MPKKTKKSKATTKIVHEVTLLQNGFIGGKFYKAGETVEVSKDLRDYLRKTSPEVYQ